MVRVNLKGGVWKNTEDEILKAGIMKYGKNNWGAIASLLHKKTPKQCKARWTEWLDPSIKKTEWTREEEEKLLHLAKIFPNQWRTIGPMLQRTAHQCIEHFTYLSDLALGKDVTEASQDPNRLRPGEIDPNPENKPARPDAIDMDDDEKEMLQEARARLANTQGKKQRRKAREKVLEDARQLAQLQKLRELRAAGIEVKAKRKDKREMDHNRDIVNFHAPVQGSFDVSEDRAKEAKIQQTTSFIGKTIKDIEGESQQEKEQKARLKDIKKDQLRRQIDLPGAIAQTNKRNDAVIIRERAPLVLPAPQLTDDDLETIKKHGGLSQLQHQVMQQATGAIASRPEGQSASDRIMQEARTIHALQSAQTPLQGGENIPIPTPGDFSGLAPKRTVAMTPHVLGTGAGAGMGGVTPMIGMGGVTPMIGMGAKGMGMGVTPMRPAIGMAVPGAMQPYPGATPLVGDMRAPRPVPMAQGGVVTATRQRLQAAWARLPQAEAKYELEWPELPPEPVVSLTQVTHLGLGSAVEAEEDLEMKKMVAAEKERARKLAETQRESLVVQRNLVRPQQINNGAEKALRAAAAVDSVLAPATADAVQQLIREEALKWMKYDHVKHPQDKAAAQRPVDSQRLAAVQLSYIADKDIAHARALVASEMERMPKIQPLPAVDGVLRASDVPIAAMDDDNIDEPASKRVRLENDANGNQVHSRTSSFDVSLTDMARKWVATHDDIAFSPSHRTFVSLKSLNNEGKIAALRQQFQLISAWHSQELDKAQKLEKNIAVMLKGYETRGKKLQSEIFKAHKDLLESIVKQRSFEEIQQVERTIGSTQRLKEARERIEGLKMLESKQQDEYVRLQRELNSIKP